MFTEPVRSPAGLYVVKWGENFVAWLAWREYLHAVFRKTFFPDTLTQPLAWPPTTSEGAKLIANKLRETREQVVQEGGKGISRGNNWKPIPENPRPWNEWSNAERTRVARLENARRSKDGSNFGQAPAYPWFVSDWRDEQPRGRPEAA